jgi:hypothetical protein
MNDNPYPKEFYAPIEDLVAQVIKEQRWLVKNAIADGCKTPKEIEDHIEAFHQRQFKLWLELHGIGGKGNE